MFRKEIQNNFPYIDIYPKKKIYMYFPNWIELPKRIFVYIYIYFLFAHLYTFPVSTLRFSLRNTNI